jgi:chloramphenicol O-acetyltransferase type A
MCANVDLTTFLPEIKKGGYSFTAAIMYVLARAANEIVEFRYRISGEGVVEYEIVHPSTTILTVDNLFGFCSVNYSEDFVKFEEQAVLQFARAREKLTLEDEPGPESLLFMTAIPWLSFTSFMHPLNLEPVDSVPRFAWGKYFWDGEILKMPLSVQGHHALMDGLHIGKYYVLVQEYLSNPKIFIGD